MPLMREGPELATNDILWEGLIAPITLIRFRERATSFITDIVLCEFECSGANFTEVGKPGRIHLR